MSTIPESPSDFFTSYLPARFAALPPQVLAAVAAKSSPGSLVCRVLSGGGEQAFSMRLRAGKLEVAVEAAADAVLTISIPAEDFVPILIEGSRIVEATNPSLEKQLIAFKALTIDPERTKLVRSIPGSMAFAIKDGDRVRKLALTPGNRPPKVDNAECRVDCLMSDFRDMQTGKVQPMQLFMNQKMKMVGNAQIPMALSTVFI